MLPPEQLQILRNLIGARIRRAQLFQTVGIDPDDDDVLSDDLFLETDRLLGSSEGRCAYFHTLGDGQTPEVLLKPPTDVLQWIGGCGLLLCRIVDIADVGILGRPELVGMSITNVDVISFEDDGVPTGIAITFGDNTKLFSVPNVEACNHVITSLESEHFPVPIALIPVERFFK